jgi:hypothetical protein
MYLVLQPVLRGPRRRRMDPLDCLLNVHTHFVHIQRRELLCVGSALRNNNKPSVPLILSTKSL